MTADRTEADLRTLLALDSLDVGPPERLLARLADPVVPERRGSLLLWLAASVAVIALVVMLAGRFAPAEPAPVSTVPAVTAPHTEHLSLREVPHFRVTAAEDLGDREVLEISYELTGQDSYEGGAITLYDADVFPATTFLARADAVPGRGSFFGSYAYTGTWGSVTTLAWPLTDGRWVSVQNLRGPADVSSRSTARKLELRVANAVVVR